MSEFKVGDWVRCVEDCISRKKGDTFQIGYIPESHPGQLYPGEDSGGVVLFANRARKLDIEEELMQSNDEMVKLVAAGLSTIGKAVPVHLIWAITTVTVTYILVVKGYITALGL